MKIKYETPEMEIFKFELSVFADAVRTSQGDGGELCAPDIEDMECMDDNTTDCPFDF